MLLWELIFPKHTLVMDKTCTACKEEKNLDQYYKQTKAKDGYRNVCKPCDKVRRNASRYGLTPEQYNQMYVDQEGKCYICETHEGELSQVLYIDHCHVSGNVRKLLCHECNTGIGMFKDNPKLLQRALQYVQKSL